MQDFMGTITQVIAAYISSTKNEIRSVNNSVLIIIGTAYSICSGVENKYILLRLNIAERK